MLYNKKLTIIISCLLISAAITSVVLFGIVGYSRSRTHDIQCFYIAGQTWLRGLNGYDAAVACKLFGQLCHSMDYSFAYPPSSVLFVMLLAMLNLEDAALAFLMINILCLITFVYINIIILSEFIGNDLFVTSIRKSLLIAMGIGNVAVANTLWMGQTSIIISTFLILSYYFYFHCQDIKSGLFLSFALIKPQLAYPFFLWLLLERKWKILATSLISTVFLFMVPFNIRGIGQTLSEWINGMGYYIGLPANQAGNFTLSSISQLLSWMGFQAYAPFIAICISLFLVAGINRYYKNSNLICILGMLSMISLLFGQAHHYDLVLATTILPFFLFRIPETDYWSLFILILLFVIFNIPRQSFILKFDYWLLNSHREIMLFIALLFMAIKCDRYKA